MCVLLFCVLHRCSLAKKLISKGIPNICYWEKADVPKSCRKSKFLGKKIWRNVLALKSIKVQGIFGETFILVLLSSAVFRLQNYVSDFFNWFCSGDKRLLSEFLRK